VDPKRRECEANKLAQVASGYVAQDDDVYVDIMQLTMAVWRADLFNYLRDPARGADKKTRQ